MPKTNLRKNRGRKGLLRDYRQACPTFSLGVRNWCPCCLSPEWNRTNGKHPCQKMIKKRIRAYGKKLIKNALLDLP